jgi:hypothetical protein
VSEPIRLDTVLWSLSRNMGDRRPNRSGHDAGEGGGSRPSDLQPATARGPLICGCTMVRNELHNGLALLARLSPPIRWQKCVPHYSLYCVLAGLVSHTSGHLPRNPNMRSVRSYPQPILGSK